MSIKSVSALLAVSLLLVLTAPAMAQETSMPAPASTPVPSINSKLTDGLACMKAAIDKREASVLGAWDAGSASIKNALTARQTALNTALGIVIRKDRNAALTKTWNDFRISAKSARSAFNTARNIAWKQFGADGKACRTKYGASNTTSLDVGGSSGNDLSL